MKCPKLHRITIIEKQKLKNVLSKSRNKRKYAHRTVHYVNYTFLHFLTRIQRALFATPYFWGLYFFIIEQESTKILPRSGHLTESLNIRNNIVLRHPKVSLGRLIIIFNITKVLGRSRMTYWPLKVC